MYEHMTEEEQQAWREKNSKLLQDLKESGLVIGRVRLYVAPDDTLSVIIRDGNPNIPVDEFLFNKNGNIYQKVHRGGK